MLKDMKSILPFQDLIACLACLTSAAPPHGSPQGVYAQGLRD